MKSLFKVLLIILTALIFLTVYSYLIYELVYRFLPVDIDGEFTIIFVCLLGFIITFFKLYFLNSYFEAMLNGQKKNNTLFMISTYLAFFVFYSFILFQLANEFYLYGFSGGIPIYLLSSTISGIKVYVIDRYFKARINKKT